jgi:hypothetical protein
MVGILDKILNAKKIVKLIVFESTGSGIQLGFMGEALYIRDSNNDDKINFEKMGKRSIYGVNRNHSYNGVYVLYTNDWEQYYPLAFSQETVDGTSVLALKPITINQRMAVREAYKKAILRKQGQQKTWEKLLPILIWILVVVGTFMLAFVLFDKVVATMNVASSTLIQAIETAQQSGMMIQPPVVP